jgi:transcriptional regulator with XRE-family HTH domain
MRLEELNTHAYGLSSAVRLVFAGLMANESSELDTVKAERMIELRVKGHTYPEIAKEIGVSVSTVRERLREFAEPRTLFGLRVREQRKARGWSQEDLAQRMTDAGHPMHQTTVAKLENAARPTSVDELVALGHVLGVPIAELAGEQEPDAEAAQRHHATTREMALLRALVEARDALQRDTVAYMDAYARWRDAAHEAGSWKGSLPDFGTDLPLDPTEVVRAEQEKWTYFTADGKWFGGAHGQVREVPEA